jgi:two-component SAPR family response regulator
VIFDSTKVELFSINYPPISETEKTYLEEIKSNNYSALILFASAGIGLVVMYFFYARKKKTNHSLPLKVKTNDNIVTGSGSSTLLNSIHIFGGFHIYDNQGRDIISEFSPKLKEILLLILLRSFNHYQHKGITSEELSSIIWPDSSPESVKSSRGVAINKIRKILSSVDGVDLEFSDKLWLIKINNGSRCDYAEFLRFIDAAKNKTDQVVNTLESLINAAKNGEFLKGISYEWLDPIKFSINNEAIQFIKQYFENEELKTDPEKIIRLCDLVLSFDSVDQDTIKLKIKTLLTQGKIHIAKNTYSLFVAEYKRLYDEQYPTTFDEMISS